MSLMLGCNIFASTTYLQVVVTVANELDNPVLAHAQGHHEPTNEHQILGP